MTLPDEAFAELDPLALAKVLTLYGTEPGEGPVEIEVQAPDGTVVAGGLVRLHVGLGRDADRVETWTWVKITARQEPRAVDMEPLRTHD